MLDQIRKCGQRVHRAGLIAPLLVRACARYYHSFEAGDMTDSDLKSYCVQHNIRIDATTADRSKLTTAVENHKFKSTMGPARAILYEKLDASSTFKLPSLQYTMNAKSIKDQTNALHIFVKSKRPVSLKKRAPEERVYVNLPMEVVTIAADASHVCFTFADGTHSLFAVTAQGPEGFQHMARNVMQFLREAKPRKSYALFQCSSTPAVIKLLLAICHGKHPDVEFSFNARMFYRSMQPYHRFVRLGTDDISAVTIAKNLGVSSPRQVSESSPAAGEGELVAQTRDFHSVLELYRKRLNPFPQGAESTIDALLTSSWNIVLFQHVPQPKFSKEKSAATQGILYLANEDRIVPFSGIVKYQLMQSMVDWLKKASKGIARYLFLYTDEADAKKLRVLVSKIKIRCDFMALRQVVPHSMAKQMRTEDPHSTFWRPDNLWKSWKRALTANGIHSDHLRFMQRLLASRMLFKKAVIDHVAEAKEVQAENCPSTETVAHLQTVQDPDFAMPSWLRFLNDPLRAAREAACAEKFADFLLVHLTPEGIFARLNTEEPITAESVEKLDLDGLKTCQVLVLFEARDMLQKLWGRQELHDFIKRGGRVWCITFASYLLNGKQAISSDAILRSARNMLSKPSLSPAQKLEILETYFTKQKELAVQNRQMQLLTAMFPTTITVNELRHNKIHFEPSGIPAARGSVSEEIRALQADLERFIPEAARPHFKWDTRTHIRSLFLGGQIPMSGDAAGDCLQEMQPPIDPTLALCLAYQAGCLTEAVAAKYTNASRLVDGLSAEDQQFFAQLEKAIQAICARKRPLRFYIADLRTTGFNVADDHITDLVVYDPATGTRVHKFPEDTDNLVLSANSGMFAEAFIRKHFQNTGTSLRSVFFADISTLIAQARARAVGRQVCLTAECKFTDNTALNKLLDGASGLWRDLITVHRGDITALVGSLVGGQNDPFLTLAGNDGSIELPGMVSHAKKVANSRMRDGKSDGLTDLLHHEGTPEAQKLCTLMSHMRLLSSPFMSSTLAASITDSKMPSELQYLETRTGRFTAARPNVLAIPKDTPLRRCFTSRFGSEGFLLEFDYSMLELCTMAVLCGDRNMLNDMNANIDFHTRNVAALYPKYSYEELVRKIKVENNEFFVKLRERAKTFAFQRLYGASQAGIVKSTGLSEAQVNALLREERVRYPGIGRFNRDFRLAVRRFKPELQFPQDLMAAVPTYIGEGVIPSGSTFRFEQTVQGAVPVFSSTAMKNYPVQGLAAEIAHVMASKIALALKTRGYLGGKAFLTNVIHDSFVFDVHESALDECFPLVEGILQNVSQTFGEMYPEMHWKHARFRVKANIGRNWGAMQPIKSPAAMQKEKEEKSRK